MKDHSLPAPLKPLGPSVSVAEVESSGRYSSGFSMDSHTGIIIVSSNLDH